MFFKKKHISPYICNPKIYDPIKAALRKASLQHNAKKNEKQVKEKSS